MYHLSIGISFKRSVLLLTKNEGKDNLHHFHSTTTQTKIINTSKSGLGVYVLGLTETETYSAKA
eukprot:UN04088